MAETFVGKTLKRPLDASIAVGHKGLKALEARTPAVPYVADSLTKLFTHTPDYVHATKKGKRLSPWDVTRAMGHYAVDFGIGAPIIVLKGISHGLTGKPSRH